MNDEKLLTADALMTGAPDSVQPAGRLADAAAILVASGLPMVPVCGTDGRLQGIVTAMDLLDSLAGNPAAADVPIDAVMSTVPAFVTGDSCVEWALAEMQEAHLWALPVTDIQYRVIGILSLRDLGTPVFPGLLLQSWRRITEPDPR